ncbi:hypothetical protein H5410_015723 [Solanum commersonii]|uniref:Uncharacterized protein n=1 Tax=Solanum commersonii TaxID=4109 RepID=A0A9J5ZUX8_SOLCO|nr:hypothetical protein H5410_015723 [Solanum commersonii]
MKKLKSEHHQARLAIRRRDTLRPFSSTKVLKEQNKKGDEKSSGMAYRRVPGCGLGAKFSSEEDVLPNVGL